MLYEKYRPTSLTEYIGNEKIIKELTNWLEGYYNLELSKNIDRKANILIIGPPGIGKTSLAHLLLNKYDFDVIEFNASDLRNAEQIENVFNDILKSSHNVAHMMNNKKKKIGVIMDEIDGLSSGDKGGMKKIQYYLQKNNFFCPIILTSNISNNLSLSSKKMSEIRKSCSIHILENIPNYVVYNHIDGILKKECLTEYITPPFVNILIQNSKNDFRIIFNSIELVRLLIKTKKLDITEMWEYLKNNSKDIDYDIYQGTERIYRSNMTSDEIFTLFDLERYNLPISVWDNLYKYITNFNTNELLLIKRILRNYVDSIHIEDQIYNKLNWDLFDSQCSLTIFTVYILFRYIDNKSKNMHNRDNSNTKLLSRMNCINANRDTREKITNNFELDKSNYHLYIEYLMLSLLENPLNIKIKLDELNISKEECLRLLKSSDCKDRILPRLKDIGIITQKELEKAI